MPIVFLFVTIDIRVVKIAKNHLARAAAATTQLYIIRVVSTLRKYQSTCSVNLTEIRVGSQAQLVSAAAVADHVGRAASADVGRAGPVSPGPVSGRRTTKVNKTNTVPWRIRI